MSAAIVDHVRQLQQPNTQLQQLIQDNHTDIAQYTALLQHYNTLYTQLQSTIQPHITHASATLTQHTTQAQQCVTNTDAQLKDINSHLYNPHTGVLHHTTAITTQLHGITNQLHNIQLIQQVCATFDRMYAQLAQVEQKIDRNVLNVIDTILHMDTTLHTLKQQYKSIDYTYLYTQLHDRVQIYRQRCVDQIMTQLTERIKFDCDAGVIDLTITTTEADSTVTFLSKLNRTEVLMDYLLKHITAYLTQVFTDESLNCVEPVCRCTQHDSKFIVHVSAKQDSLLDVVSLLMQYVKDIVLSSDTQLFDTLYGKLIERITSLTTGNITNSLPIDVAQLHTFQTTNTPRILEFEQQLNALTEAVQTHALTHFSASMPLALLTKIEHNTYAELKQLITDNAFELYNHKTIDAVYYPTSPLYTQAAKLLTQQFGGGKQGQTAKHSEAVVCITHLIYQSVCYYLHCMDSLKLQDSVRCQSFIANSIQLYTTLYTNYFSNQFNTVAYMNLLYINDSKVLTDCLLQLQALLLLQRTDNNINFVSDIERLCAGTNRQYVTQLQHNCDSLRALMQDLDPLDDKQAIDTINQAAFEISKLRRTYVQLGVGDDEIMCMVSLMCTCVADAVCRLTEISVDNNAAVDEVLTALISKVDGLNVGGFDIKQHKVYQVYQFVKPNQHLASLRSELIAGQYKKLKKSEARQLVMALYEFSEKRDGIVELIDNTLS